MKTIPDVLFEQAKIQPGALAIHDGVWRLSYQDLAERVVEAARVLRAMGFARGDRFAIWAPNCAEWIIITLAGQALGGVLVPLNTRYKGAEAADIMRRAHCRFLFTVEGFLGHDYPAMLEGENLPELAETVIIRGSNETAAFESFMAREKLSGDFPVLGASDMCDIIFTSGTTGAPKGAMTCHGQNVEVFRAFTDAIGMNAQDRYLVVNPFFHSFGYKAGWLSCLIKGAAIFPLAMFDPADVLRRIEIDRITVMPGAPTIFQALLGHENLADYDISSLRVATTGAAMIPVDLIRRMHEDLGIDDVFSAYCLTESTGVVSLCQKGDDFETIATTCGRPLPGTELQITDANGQAAAPGEEGEIWVRGFNVMTGYLDDEAATKNTITPEGWLRTGDIGLQDARGYIRITDRMKDMVIVGGFNCYPAEIERVLLQHPDIADAAVTGKPDARLGEVTHAHIVLRGGAEMDLGALKAWSRECMANYKVPRGVDFHDVLPRNASGKVQKFKLL